VRSVGAEATLKWPNDILVGGRKVAGILLEAQSQGSRLESLIAGIGVNLSAPLPPELADIGTTLLAGVPTANHAAVARAQFLPVLLASIEQWVDRYVAVGVGVVVDAWNQRMMRDLIVRAGAITGTALGVDIDGNLRLRDAAGTIHTVRAGDVEIVRRVTTGTTPSRGVAAITEPPPAAL
jgi:BirA family biotin operon repressor/biotin-[acetyl-CoA-carboxylase] ligase